MCLSLSVSWAVKALLREQIILVSSTWLWFWLESCVRHLLRIMIIIKNNNSSIVFGVRQSVMPLSQASTSVGFVVHAMLARWGEETDTDLCGV